MDRTEADIKNLYGTRIKGYENTVAGETERYKAAGNNYLNTGAYSSMQKNIAHETSQMNKELAELSRYTTQMDTHAKANSPAATALLQANPTAYMQQYGTAQDVKNQQSGVNPTAITPPVADPTALRADANGLAPTATPLGGAHGTQADLNAKYAQGFNQVKGSGIQSPQDGGTARQIVQSSVPQGGGATNPVLDSLFTEDKNMSNFSTMVQDYLNPKTQQKSLKEEYEALTASKGIQGMNTDLMNMKNVIEGTEDDIRTEITKSGGFATDSQVMALSNARNKTLIKNYNNLLQTKQQAEDYIKTVMGLEADDRTAAQARLDSQINLSAKLMEMQEKMQTNARTALNNVVTKVGYDGLAKMAQNDPYYT